MSDKPSQSPSITQYKLVSECFKWQQLVDQLDENQSLPEDLPSIVVEKSSIPELTNTLLYYIAEAEGLEEMTSKEIAALTERKNRFKRRAENMRLAIKNVFERFDIKKLETPLSTVYIQKSSKLCVIDEGALLMDHGDLFIRQDPKLNKTALKKLLASGEVIDGVEMQDRTMLVIRK